MVIKIYSSTIDSEPSKNEENLTKFHQFHQIPHQNYLTSWSPSAQATVTLQDRLFTNKKDTKVPKHILRSVLQFIITRQAKYYNVSFWHFCLIFVSSQLP
jgi:hypothetical protein